jgi:hypothetical protein
MRDTILLAPLRRGKDAERRSLADYYECRVLARR